MRNRPGWTVSAAGCVFSRPFRKALEENESMSLQNSGSEARGFGQIDCSRGRPCSPRSATHINGLGRAGCEPLRPTHALPCGQAVVDLPPDNSRNAISVSGKFSRNDRPPSNSSVDLKSYDEPKPRRRALSRQYNSFHQYRRLPSIVQSTRAP